MYHRIAFDVAAGGHLQQRNVAAGIHGEEFGRAGYVPEHVDLDQLMWDVELRKRKPLPCSSYLSGAWNRAYTCVPTQFAIADIADKRAKRGDCKARA